MDRLGATTGAAATLRKLPLRFQAGPLLLLLAALLLGLAALGASLDDQAGGALTAVLGGGAVLCAALGVALLMRRASGRIEMFERGLTVERRGRTVPVHFDELASVSLAEKVKFSGGVRRGLHRRAALQTAAARVTFESYAADALPDELAPLVDLLIARAAEAAKARVDQGGALRGDGWSLGGEGLRVGRQPPVALSLVDHVAIFDGKASLWREGQDLPFLAVDVAGPNARLLLQIAAQHGRKSEPGDQGGMGRILFRRGASKVAVGVALFLGVPLSGLGVAMLVSDTDNMLAAGLACLALGLPFLFFGALLLAQRLHCHERGLVERTLFGKRSLRYEEVELFSYAATRHYHNGAYTGTSLALAFHPAQGKPIKHKAWVSGGDADLDLLRDHVSGVVAARLYDRLKSEPEVAWGSAARLSREGVRFSPKKILWLFGGKPQSALFAQDVHYKIENGILQCLVEGKRVGTVGCADLNFYPGFMLFERLAAEAAQKR